MLATTSSSELKDPGNDLNHLVRLLWQRVNTGEPFPADSFIKEADLYSASPAELVRDHGPGTDLGEGKGMAWYFCCPANYHQTRPGTRRRKRKVAGGRTRWHVEKAVPILVLGPDDKPVGASKRKLSYVEKIKNPPGTARKTSGNKSLGWIMVEIELEQQDGPGQQLVLCKVYKSPRTDAAEASVPCTPTPAPPPCTSKSPCDKHKVTPECKATLDYHLRSPGLGRKPALSARKPGTQRRPPKGEKITRGWAIVKKGSVPAAAGETVVMKFGGSSMKSADHMKEMAKIVFSLPTSEGDPVVVLSAVGNTTTNLFVAAGKALSCGTEEASKIHELAITRDIHLRMTDDLGLDSSIISDSFDELKDVFMGIAKVKRLTSETRDYLFSFGGKMSTTIFSTYLNKLGERTCQEWELYAGNTFGKGGSDLTAATIGRDMRSREIQVWKDVDGVLTCDPYICANAIPLCNLTFDEAAELGLFGAQLVQLAIEGSIRVAVKNLGNPQAHGTLITTSRDMSKVILTSIVLKSNVTMLNIRSKGMLRQSSFLAMSFSVLENMDIFFNCVATSEGKISFVTVPSKALSRELVKLELDKIVGELKGIAIVDRLEDRSVISLIGNAQMSQLILEKASSVLRSINVTAQIISHASSEVMKISFVVNDHEAEHCVQALHSAFFENGLVSEAKDGVKKRKAVSQKKKKKKKKRKAGDEHHSPRVRQERADTTSDRSPSVIERTVFPNNDPIDIGGEPLRIEKDGLPAAGVLPQPQAVHPEQPSDVDANHGAQEKYNRLRAYLDHDSPMPVRGDDTEFEWFADILQSDNYPMFDDSGLGIPLWNAEAEQQGRTADAAEGGSPLLTEEEEVIQALIAGPTPDESFGSPSGDMAWPPPALASSLHVAGECQAAFCGLCITDKIGI